MALLIDSSTPLGTDSPTAGDDQIRAFKLAVRDIFGIPNNTTLTTAAATMDSSGLATLINALGTAALPSYTFRGDLNTGVFSSGADAVDVVGGGLRLMTLTSTPAAGIVSINPGAISATASTNVGRLFVGGTSALTIPAGTTTIAAGLFVAEPNFTATGTITNAATIYVAAAPTEGGTTNSALWIDSGDILVDDGIRANSLGVGANPSGTAGRLTINENAIVNTGGNVKVGAATNRATTEATNSVYIFDGTAPVGTLTNGISLYSTAGELRVMDAAGNPTLLSPHDRSGYWIFESRSGRTGKMFRVHMERLVRMLNDQYGGQFIEDFDDPLL